MKRKDAARKEGTCPRDAPKDEKCANCRSKKGACLVAARIAAENALPSPDEPSTSKPRTTQPAADSDMDDAEPRPSRERKAPERIEVDDLATARYATSESPGWSCADIGPVTSVGTITRTKFAATASTSTLHAAMKRHTAGLPRSVP